MENAAAEITSLRAQLARANDPTWDDTSSDLDPVGKQAELTRAERLP